MSLLLTVLEIVSPVFILATIGFIWIKMGWEYPIEFITNITMSLSLPCLIFVSLMKTQIKPEAVASTFFAAALTYVALTLAFYIVVKIFSLELRTFLPPLIFSNTGNLGLPLALFAFGDLGFDYAILVFAVMAVYAYSIGIWMISGGGSLRAIIREPVVIATILGAIFMVQGWQTPQVLTNTLDLVGQIVIPLMLITLGAALAKLKAPSFGRNVWLSVIKFVICASIAFGIGTWFDLEPVALAVLILQVSTPVAVTSYLLAQKYGANADEVAGLVVISTALSIIGLPLLLSMLL